MTRTPEIAAEAEAPRVFDTYAVSYAFMLLFLVPGVLAIGRLPFRTYTFAYVSLVTLPFVLGIVATFITDTRESLKTIALRSAILTPLIVVTGVGVMFTVSIALWPMNKLMSVEFREMTTPLGGLILIALVAPLIVSLVKRLRTPFNVRTAVQALVLALAFIVAVYVGYLSVFDVGRLGALARMARKDIVIYIVGGLVWYLPSFGIAAGVWRRVGLV